MPPRRRPDCVEMGGELTQPFLTLLSQLVESPPDRPPFPPGLRGAMIEAT